MCGYGVTYHTYVLAFQSAMLTLTAKTMRIVYALPSIFVNTSRVMSVIIVFYKNSVSTRQSQHSSTVPEQRVPPFST